MEVRERDDGESEREDGVEQLEWGEGERILN